ncbi:MAG: ISAs1 family transposase [Tannerella sp.]|jgi:hypothetical protein|nr:ISAs1 family transposase [Tannerella sp.]
MKNFHGLEDILFIALASIICGAESWYEMEEFGKGKEEWLKTFLRLPGGIPSHDTFNRVFSALEAEELEKSFIAWTQSVACLSEGEVVAIDGKSMRGTKKGDNKSIVHMISAWGEKSENTKVIYINNFADFVCGRDNGPMEPFLIFIGHCGISQPQDFNEYIAEYEWQFISYL